MLFSLTSLISWGSSVLLPAAPSPGPVPGRELEATRVTSFFGRDKHQEAAPCAAGCSCLTGVSLSSSVGSKIPKTTPPELCFTGGACWRKSGRGICLAELSLDTLVSWHNVVASPDPFPGVLYECGFGTFTAWLLSAYSELVQQVGKCKDLVEQVWQSWQQRADMSRLPRDQSCRQSLAMGRSLQVRVCPGERGHGKGREHPAAAHGMLKGKRHLGNAPRCENKQMDEDSLGGWRLNLPTKSSGHFVKSYHLMLLVCGNESCWGSQGCLERLDTPKLYSHSVTLPVHQH